MSKNWRTECPLLAAFLDAAMQNNSGSGLVMARELNISVDELIQAEEELMYLLGESMPATPEQIEKARWLGVMADDGYTLHLPDTGEDAGAGPNPGPMKCFDILDREY